MFRQIVPALHEPPVQLGGCAMQAERQRLLVLQPWPAMRKELQQFDPGPLEARLDGFAGPNDLVADFQQERATGHLGRRAGPLAGPFEGGTQTAFLAEFHLVRHHGLRPGVLSSHCRILRSHFKSRALASSFVFTSVGTVIAHSTP